MSKVFHISASILAVAFATPSLAQNQSTADQADAYEDIVVTGSRAAARSRLDTISPVDVLSAETLRNQGSTELAEALATVAPSITFPRASAVDGTDSIRPATLRGLSPDQTLVLINGIRGHASALLNVNGSVGRGSAAVDLNTIPGAALGQIEVLRDGASAQYGSDAIAGVVNLRLREARSGGGGSISYSEHVTNVDTARDDRNVTDGGALTVSGWQGFALGSEGFLTLSGEYLNRNPPSRGDIDPRATPLRVRSRFGDPDVEQYSVYANAGVPIGGDGWELYGHGGYQRRDSESAAFPRTPDNANNVPSVYPDGYLPLIAVRSNDYTAAVGVRGELSGWQTDLNISYGRNSLDFRTLNSINSTYGAASPTDFDDGSIAYDQLTGGIDVSNELPLGEGKLNVAFGLEYRREGYKIEAGQPESWDRGPLGSTNGVPNGLTGGAQGFIGFQPSNEVDVHRDNVSGYLDLEAQLTDAFSIGLAVRGESYSDFGETATGKVSARYDISDSFALRGAISTGFRAPSLQQSYFTSTASVVQTPLILETGTFPATSPVARALGALPLDPEKSWNYSAGAVFRSGDFNLTIDGYYIRIRDQLALSENIQSSFSPEVASILQPFGIQAARFFINGIKSSTKGVDIVANYRIQTASAGRFDLSAAANINDIEVNRVPTSTATLDPAPTLFARSRILTIEEGTPRTKIVGSADWRLGDFSTTLRATYYGDVNQPGTAADGSADLHTGKKTLVDLEARYDITPNFTLAVGADNLFDVYPNQVPVGLNTSGVTAFPFYSPFGFNGRQLYARISANW